MPLSTTTRRLLLAAAVAGVVALGAHLLQPSPLSAHEQGALTGLAIGILVAALLSVLTGDFFSDAMTPALMRRYYRHIALPLLAFVVLTLLRKRLLDHVDAPGLRAVVALLPMLPLALLLYIAIRHARQMDELQRRIEAESVALSATLVGLACLATSSLQRAGLVDLSGAAAMQLVLPLMSVVYIPIRLLIQRRYR